MVSAREGGGGHDEIELVLQDARVVWVLAGPEILRSDFSAERGLPAVLASAARSGSTALLWAVVSPCDHQRSPLAPYTHAYPPDQPLDQLDVRGLDEALSRICWEIERRSLTE